jgi:hypothetical protein
MTLETSAPDHVAIALWEPDGHARDQGRYPFVPFLTNDGQPSTIEWARTIRLERGQTTVFRARLGPLAKE